MFRRLLTKTPSRLSHPPLAKKPPPQQTPQKPPKPSHLPRRFSTCAHLHQGKENQPNYTATSESATTLLDDHDPETGLGFIKHNPRPAKPRTTGVTEIRGPYYSVMGQRYLHDILETMGHHVDGLKFAGGSFALLPRARLAEMLALAHAHGVYVSTGGFVEHILAHPTGTSARDSVRRYLRTCKTLGFDTVEVSRGFLALPDEDFVRLVADVQREGLTAKPELGIAFGAGGDTPGGVSVSPGAVNRLVALASRLVAELGVTRIMIESEGITENVPRDQWRTDVADEVIRAVGLERVMFEASEPAVFGFYVKEYGKDVNLFVDHSQIVQLAALREGIWGTSEVWGRVAGYGN